MEMKNGAEGETYQDEVFTLFTLEPRFCAWDLPAQGRRDFTAAFWEQLLPGLGVLTAPALQAASSRVFSPGTVFIPQGQGSTDDPRCQAYKEMAAPFLSALCCGMGLLTPLTPD